MFPSVPESSVLCVRVCVDFGGLGADLPRHFGFQSSNLGFLEAHPLALEEFVAAGVEAAVACHVGQPLAVRSRAHCRV